MCGKVGVMTNDESENVHSMLKNDRLWGSAYSADLSDSGRPLT